MMDITEGFPDNVVAVDCRGRITRDDYDCTLIPAVEAKLARHEKLRLLYRAGPDFDGFDPGAILEDAKLGFAHR
jgi:hypothetical protein